MGLKGFHIVFVSLSSLLAFGFGGWNLRAYSANNETGSLALGMGGLAAGLLLIAYGFWFWRKITTLDEERQRRRRNFRSAPVVLLTGWLSVRIAEACNTCYGEAEGPMLEGARRGVWLLFGMTFLVQAAFVLFFIYLWRRARKHRLQLGEP